jgi:uncharacterized protein
MAKDFDEMEDSNASANPSIHEVSSPARRTVLQGSFGVAAASLFAPWMSGCAATAAAPAKPKLGFKGIGISSSDTVRVPEGYEAQVLAPWGEPVGIAGAMPAWLDDVSQGATEQALQMGMHHDGMHFYALDGSSTRGLLVMNHEYTDDGLLHPDGIKTWSAAKVKKAQAAHGLAVIEVEFIGGRWAMRRPSRFARRVTADTPFAVGGPAAGHVLMRTAADTTGTRVLGTIGNCASGKTPWGTYLSGEENWAGYFQGSDTPTTDQRRWGLRKNQWYRWDEHDERFDARKHPNEFHRFGWVVELDPMDPASTPVKRTAIGRAAHEGAWVAVTKDQRAVVYSGEDARFEYIYKFVSRDRIQPAGNGLTQPQANRTLLDHGTLYVARYDADGSGRWLPLVHGQGPLTAANGFADQGEVVIKARQASDLLGATNNSARGAAGQPGVDGANPRANNLMGHIIRWKDEGDFDGLTLKWNHLVLAGVADSAKPEHRGNIKGDAFACPDTIAFDGRGVLWIGSDISPTSLNKGEMQSLGNNQLLACDVATGEVRRFLTGPVGCELTAATFSPDGTTMFVNIQHPGESPAERSDPADPRRYSNWPDFKPNGRPRSATVAIRKRDGGVIGS